VDRARPGDDHDRRDRNRAVYYHGGHVGGEGDRERAAGWRSSVAAGWDPDALALRPEVYEGRVERRVLGTLWLGVFGRSDKTGGLSAAMEW